LRLVQLQMERMALEKESDDASKKRLADLQEEIDQLTREYADLDEIWKAEKSALEGSTSIKEQIEQERLELENARRAGDLERMSEIQYGRLPELESKLEQAEAGEGQENQLLHSEVTEAAIAEVVSRWTGIPVAKM
ncbi:MAG: type VI secretion system ATPase TssH, partial [Gammaproteobacteria bacterium]